MNSINVRLAAILSALTMLTLPYIASLKLLNAETRPLCALFVLPLSVAFLFKSTFDVYDRKVIWIFVVLFGYGIYGGALGLIHGVSAMTLVRQAIIFYAGIFAIFGFYYLFKVYSLASIYKFVLISLIPVFVVGFVEVAVVLGAAPKELKILLNNLFSGSSVGRIQLTMSEASWASKICLFYFSLLLYLKQRGEIVRNAFLFLLMFFFFATFSIYGFIILILSFVSLWLVFARQPFLLLVKCVFYGAIGALIFALVFYFLKAIVPDAYYLSRIDKMLSVVSIRDLLLVDGSVFLRIGNGAIAFLMFKDHPFGVGFGGYPIYYDVYLSAYFPEAFRFPEVAQDVASRTADPKGLYFKMIAELGFVSILFFFVIGKFFIWLRREYQHVSCSKKKYHIRSLALLIFVIIYTGLQSGSFVYYPYELGVGICIAYMARGSSADKNT